MKNKNISTFLGCDNEYNESGIVVFGAPYDSTTSFRPGSRFASQTMRIESWGLETYSPYQNKSLDNIAVFDEGDLEFGFGNNGNMLIEVAKTVNRILLDGKIPCMIGGEHLVTLGAVRAVAKLYPDVNIIHFDAHADLRDTYLSERFSHACVMRRVWEIVGDGKIFQFGIRSGDRSEFEWANEHVVMNKFNFDKLRKTVTSLIGKPVYFTLDLDVLDPSFFSGTGTPEPGGVTFNELLTAMMELRRLSIVGFDINELSPHYDMSGASTAAACKILRELLLLFY